ncbi:MAG: acyl-ACP thioesterase domain-containing protein [Bdellovibrionota bacterium]|nr:acyl-ACP thioesterase domain-containing protein [Bdellovibrionota bacterium]
MSDLVFEKTYDVNSINININKRLGLFGMLGILQDTGAIHAEHLGFGLEDMIKKNSFWVITQQKLKMQYWPKWQDQVLIKTWPRRIQGLKAYRDYQIFLKDRLIGECVGTFMVLDGTTRRPVQPQLDGVHFAEGRELDLFPEKIDVPKGIELQSKIKVRNSDLDMNNHVNNTKYSQWILDTIAIDYHRKYVVNEFNVNFISEARLGEEIEIYSQMDEHEGHITSYYQGVRVSDQKKVFSARIQANRI